MRFVLLNISILLAMAGIGQKPVVLLHVDPKEAKPGEILTITVRSNVQGEIDIELPSGFVHGYNVMNGMEQEMDYSTGKVVTYYYMSQTGAMSKEGNYTFGPALIKKGGKFYKSNTVNITIRKEIQQNTNSGEISARQLREPAFGIVECSRNSVYEGEPILLAAKIYSHFNPTHLENYQPYSMDGVIEKHELGNNQRILVEETKVKGMRLYSFTYDKNVLFPTTHGKVGIEPFKMILRSGFEGIPVTSASGVIEVKPLPKAPSDFGGGVGQFTVTRSISGNKFKQGEVLQMTLTISGHGNLHNLIEPPLHLPKGFIVYGDPIVKENIQYTSRGAEGSVSYNYHIQITKHGDLSFPGTSFTYFDPAQEKYVRLQTDGNELIVQKDTNFKPNDELEQGQTEILNSARVGPMRKSIYQSQLKDPFGNTGFFIGLGTPAALAFILGFYFRRRKIVSNSHIPTISAEENRKETLRLLNEANQALTQGEKEKTFLLVERCMTLHLNYLLGTTQSPLSGSSLVNKCREQFPEIAEQAGSIIENCQLARYGMGLSEIGDELINKARQVLNLNA